VTGVGRVGCWADRGVLDGSAGPLDGRPGRLRAAAIAAVAVEGLLGWSW